jgi:hypothetical protein
MDVLQHADNDVREGVQDSRVEYLSEILPAPLYLVICP